MALISDTKLELGKPHTFEDLEKYLFQHENRAKFLKLYDSQNKQNAIMHVFFENFCSDWKSGDGILFYDDGETHSADSEDLFVVKEIISM